MHAAAMLGSRFEVTGALADLDEQVALLDTALGLAEVDSEAACECQRILAGAHATRFERSDHAVDNERSIALLELVLPRVRGATRENVLNVLAPG